MTAIEFRRHAEREQGVDALSARGRTQAEDVGRTLPADYAFVFVSPAKRAAETAAWMLRGSGQSLPPHVVTPGLGTELEERWRRAAKGAGTSRIDALAAEDPRLVQEEAGRLAAAARQMLGRMGEGRRGLAVGHSPLIEAMMYGLTGAILEPLAECEGVLVTRNRDGGYSGEELRLSG
jgi:broad specificity phosphatase PhoE